MLNFFINFGIFFLSLSSVFVAYTYLNDLYQLIGIFFGGLFFGCFLMNLKLNVNKTKINSYKRELEKESISSTESEARVKVLESKIEVLEKALENALKQK